MQQQYNQIKSQHPDKIVLFRLGDFYEGFNEDAKELSRVLGITLTGRGKDESRIPMAGIPYHALPNYLPQLLEAGLKVAIVEQKTQAVAGQLVEREISKIYTPGTLTDLDNLEDSKANYLVSILKDKQKYGLAVVDASTAELMLFESENVALVLNEIGRLNAVECLVVETDTAITQSIKSRYPQILITFYKEIDKKSAYQELTEQFGTQNLKGFGVEELEIAQRAAAMALLYVKECQRDNLAHVKSCKLYPQTSYMQLDANTIRNLDLLYSQTGDSRATLYYQLNRCQTPMGRRLLREWILFPLLSEEKLQNRWNAVESLSLEIINTTSLSEALSQIPDLARLNARIATNAANARELLAIVKGLSLLSTLQVKLSNFSKDSLLSNLKENITISTNLDNLLKELNLAIYPEPPILITEGQIIADGYNEEVDELRALRSGGKDLIAQIQANESQKTGIPSLKVGFNNVFGYYIEVTNTHISKVPETYIRKQTLANAERYITPELKELETKVLSAEVKLQQIEYNLFVELRSRLAEFSSEILELSAKVAELDVLVTFALLSKKYRYTKPKITKENKLEIIAGRHPVVERLQPQFHANDLILENNQSFVVLTGPNMSGKSTFIRQVALIVLMAQLGCFVPAEKLEFSLLDRVFTRVGASDNLARGESTFMVEMQETASILNNATDKSLVILDEVGRGTSTYDGVAIAWAIAEDLITRIKAKTLFATHYHELTQLSDDYENALNLHVKVYEEMGEIVFTHAIAKGSINKSYGVHVAKLAGLPEDVQKRAQEILMNFEKTQNDSKESLNLETKESAQNQDELAEPFKPEATQQPKNRPQPKKPAKINPSQLTLDL